MDSSTPDDPRRVEICYILKLWHSQRCFTLYIKCVSFSYSCFLMLGMDMRLFPGLAGLQINFSATE